MPSNAIRIFTRKVCYIRHPEGVDVESAAHIIAVLLRLDIPYIVHRTGSEGEGRLPFPFVDGSRTPKLPTSKRNF